jgi:hypothetical protein
MYAFAPLTAGSGSSASIYELLNFEKKALVLLCMALIKRHAELF